MPNAKTFNDLPSFSVSFKDREHIKTILDRVRGLGHEIDDMSADMDLSACHANGCPMDFERLASADNFNLLHDFYGIIQHLDRTTGHLNSRFLPRFTLKQSSTKG